MTYRGKRWSKRMRESNYLVGALPFEASSKNVPKEYSSGESAAQHEGQQPGDGPRRPPLLLFYFTASFHFGLGVYTAATSQQQSKKKSTDRKWAHRIRVKG